MATIPVATLFLLVLCGGGQRAVAGARRAPNPILLVVVGSLAGIIPMPHVTLEPDVVLFGCCRRCCNNAALIELAAATCAPTPPPPPPARVDHPERRRAGGATPPGGGGRAPGGPQLPWRPARHWAPSSPPTDPLGATQIIRPFGSPPSVHGRTRAKPGQRRVALAHYQTAVPRRGRHGLHVWQAGGFPREVAGGIRSGSSRAGEEPGSSVRGQDRPALAGALARQQLPGVPPRAAARRCSGVLATVTAGLVNGPTARRCSTPHPPRSGPQQRGGVLGRSWSSCSTPSCSRSEGLQPLFPRGGAAGQQRSAAEWPFWGADRRPDHPHPARVDARDHVRDPGRRPRGRPSGARRRHVAVPTRSGAWSVRLARRRRCPLAAALALPAWLPRARNLLILPGAGAYIWANASFGQGLTPFLPWLNPGFAEGDRTTASRPREELLHAR
jgi:hypothetical protein